MTDILTPEQSAEEAGLRYVSDSSAGYSRHRAGKGFFYRDSRGNKLTDKRTLNRIKNLAIPPAWNEVWISVKSNAHLQATGRDAKGRKQYRYHPDWAEERDRSKYEHVLEFGEALPGIRERVEKDMSKRGLPREKVIASVVKLLETTLVRIGNDEYARENKSFGLTTMRDRHVDISGSTITFSYVGKSGVDHEIALKDRQLATIVRKCRDIPGQQLFQYVDENGNRLSVNSSDVNDYLKDITGKNFTAKDFRTWAGTTLAAQALAEFGVDPNETTVQSNIVTAIERVAKQLGNTPAVCRKCYVHPAIVHAYMEGETIATIGQRARAHKELDPTLLEQAVMELIVRRLEQDESGED